VDSERDEDVLTSTAKSIGATLGKLAVKIGVATPAAETPAQPSSRLKRAPAKKKVVGKKAIVKRAVKKTAIKKAAKNQKRRGV
jgi:hypothetical protein